MLALLPAGNADAQALYNNGATLYIAPGGLLYVDGALINASGATLTNDGDLRLTGNLTNNAVMNATTAGSLLTLQGGAAQTLSGSQIISAKDVTINNSAGITLQTPLQVDGALAFSNGVVTAANASNPLIFTSNGTVAGTPTNASHVAGYVQWQGAGAFTYPVGDATNYQPVGVNLTTNADGMTAKYNAGNAGAAPYGSGGAAGTLLTSYDEFAYWDLTPASTAAGTVTIYWDGYNQPVINDIADLRVAHNNGSMWLNEGGAATGTVTAGSVTSGTVTSWSPYTLGSISDNTPLPVHLLSFNARALGAANRLDWQVATEDPGTDYNIERSADGRDFITLGSTAGRGNHAAYAFYDEKPLATISYYRLKATERTGNYTYSQVVSVKRTISGNTITIYPAPASNVVHISQSIPSLDGTTAEVLNVQGQLITRVTLIQGVTTLDVSNWSAGMYYLRFDNGEVFRLVKE